MGEKPIVQVSNLLRYGMKIDSIKNVRGTTYIERDISPLKDYIEIPSLKRFLQIRNPMQKLTKYNIMNKTP